MDPIAEALEPILGSIVDTLPRTAAFGVLFAVLAARFPCNPGKPWWRSPEIATDALWWFLFPLFGRYASLTLIVVIGSFLSIAGADTEPYLGASGPLSRLPFAAQIVVYLLLADLGLYLTHRAFHGASLWRFHAVHHSPRMLDWISANRFHPVDQALHGALPDVVLMALGIPPAAIIAVASFQSFHGALIHANLRWDFGPFRYWLVSPVYHRWHHTDVGRGGAKNFAATFPLFDWIFGTLYMPRGELPDAYGVDDPEFPTQWGRQIVYPFLPQPAPGSVSSSRKPSEETIVPS